MEEQLEVDGARSLDVSFGGAREVGDGMSAAAANVRVAASRRASRRATRRDALRAKPPRARRVAASVDDAPPSEDATNDWVAWERTRRARAREVTHALLHPGGPLEHRLIRAPLPDAPVPASLLALATGEPARHLRASLHPRRLRFPDVEGALRASCELTPGDRRLGARRIRCRAANDYLARLFLIASRPPLDHALTRHDLFHGHVFAARDVVGVLMHAHEYPAYHPETFPVHLGNCQTDSPYAFDPNVAARRNILWVARPSDRAAAFAAIDAAPSDDPTDVAVFPQLLAVPELFTTYEGDFGTVAGDILYLHDLGDRRPKHAVFAFPR